MQLEEKDNSLQLDVQQEQSEAILRMQEDTETLEELVSDTVMCTYTYIAIYVTGFAKRGLIHAFNFSAVFDLQLLNLVARLYYHCTCRTKSFSLIAYL